MKHEHLLLMHVNNNDLCAFLMVSGHGAGKKYSRYSFVYHKQ